MKNQLLFVKTIREFFPCAFPFSAFRPGWLVRERQRERQRAISFSFRLGCEGARLTERDFYILLDRERDLRFYLSAQQVRERERE